MLLLMPRRCRTRRNWSLRSARIAILLLGALVGCQPGGVAVDEAPVGWASVRERLEVPGGHWLLVLHTEREPDRKARFLGFLARRMQRADVATAVITTSSWGANGPTDDAPPPSPSRRLFVDDGTLTGLLAELSPSLGAERVWLISPDDRLDLALAADVLQDDELRQVLEKGVLGEVSGPETADAPALAAGDAFPAVPLQDVHRGEEVELSALPQRRFVFFTAACTACSLSAHLDRLTELQAGTGGEVAAVFSSRFAISEVIREAAFHRITSPLYVALDELQGLEDLYYSRGLIGDAVVVERRDERVASLQSISAYSTQEDDR
jgi:hypothetical protein